MQEEAEPKPDVMTGQKIEDITERVHYLVENSTEDSMFMTVVGTSNLRCDTAADIVDKYRL